MPRTGYSNRISGCHQQQLAPESECLENDPFLLGVCRVNSAVSFREGTILMIPETNMANHPKGKAKMSPFPTMASRATDIWMSSPRSNQPISIPICSMYGISTCMNGLNLWWMLANTPVPWSIWVFFQYTEIHLRIKCLFLPLSLLVFGGTITYPLLH